MLAYKAVHQRCHKRCYHQLKYPVNYYYSCIFSCHERTDRQKERQTSRTNFTFMWGLLRLAPIKLKSRPSVCPHLTSHVFLNKHPSIETISVPNEMLIKVCCPKFLTTVLGHPWRLECHDVVQSSPTFLSKPQPRHSFCKRICLLILRFLLWTFCLLHHYSCKRQYLYIYEVTYIMPYV